MTAVAKTEFRVDGQPYTLDDLTFAELREHRRLVRELADDPTLEVAQAPTIDFYPPLIFLVKRRSDPAFTLDEAQSGKLDDYFFEPEPAKRPTRRASAKA